MLFSRSFFQMTVTSRAGAVIFSVQNYQLAGLVAPFWHPGSPLLHIGGALGGYRSSRKDILGSRVGFSLSLCWFRDPILRAFLVLWNNTGDFSMFFTRFFFNDFLGWIWSCGAWKTRIWCERVCKNQLVTDIRIMLISVSFFMFFSGLGLSFHDFWCLGDKL